jgi:hypothetical protein
VLRTLSPDNELLDQAVYAVNRGPSVCRSASVHTQSSHKPSGMIWPVGQAGLTDHRQHRAGEVPASGANSAVSRRGRRTGPYGTAGPVACRSPAWSAEGRAGPVRDQAAGQPTSGSGPPARTRTVSEEVHGTAGRTRTPAAAEISQARLTATRLTAAGKPVSRRALRGEGIKGSNQALNALARRINTEAGRRGGHSRPRLRTLRRDPEPSGGCFTPRAAPAGDVVHRDATGRA